MTNEMFGAGARQELVIKMKFLQGITHLNVLATHTWLAFFCVIAFPAAAMAEQPDCKRFKCVPAPWTGTYGTVRGTSDKPEYGLSAGGKTYGLSGIRPVYGLSGSISPFYACTSTRPCIGGLSCASFGDEMQKRHDRGEQVRIVRRYSNHGPADAMAIEHLANLMDFPVAYTYEPVSGVVPPASDLAQLRKLAPLAELAAGQADVEGDAEPGQVATNVFELPDRAVNVIREGNFELERFSRTLGGKVRPFSILSMSSPQSASERALDDWLRNARTLIDLTDEQMYRHGVQIAVKAGSGCRTLSYAPDAKGRIGLVYSFGFGNFLSDTENGSKVTAYGEYTVQDSWHVLRGDPEAKVRFEIRPVSQNIGLLTVLPESQAMVSRTVAFDLIVDNFVQTGPNNLSFGEVARECTKLGGLNQYAEYRKRSDGRYPTFYNSIISCMTNSNFVRTPFSRVISPFMFRLKLLDTNGHGKEYYVRKYRSKAEKTFERYSVSSLTTDTGECIKADSTGIDAVTACLDKKRYQLVASEGGKPGKAFVPGLEPVPTAAKVLQGNQAASMMDKEAGMSGRVRDRFGIMAVNLPSSWSDVTSDYLYETEEYQKRHKPDPGIKSLLGFKSRNRTGFCKFRELSYAPGDEGYPWGVERLAFEVAAVRNAILQAEVADQYRMGVPVNPFQRKASHTELVESSEIEIKNNPVWRMTHEYWFGKDEGHAFITTTVLRLASSENGDASRSFVVSECDFQGDEKLMENTRKEADAMLNTVRLRGDASQD